jgi:hypothetical protein
MASLETLPPDQRAVLDLVLQRGRSYDDIAHLLAIDRAAVRARALAAFDELGPDTGVSDESRALITDYLLGQLPERMAEQTRERLASSPPDRAWARVLASELGPMAGKPLPEIPDGSRDGTPAPPAPAAADAAAPTAAAEPGASATDGTDARDAGAPRQHRPRDRGSRTPRLSDRPSSRRGGAIMLGVGALVVVALVVVLVAVLNNGSSKQHTPTAAASGTTAAGTTGTSSTSTTGAKAQIVAQSNLNPPGGSSSPAKGIAIVVKAATAYGIVIEAAHVPANNKNAYAAWLYNSPADADRLGFVSPSVGKAGTLQVESPLPANAGHFKQLLLTVETQSNPKVPGPVLLQGPFKGVPATG